MPGDSRTQRVTGVIPSRSTGRAAVLRKLVLLLAVLALFATACSGESTNTDEGAVTTGETSGSDIADNDADDAPADDEPADDTSDDEPADDSGGDEPADDSGGDEPADDTGDDAPADDSDDEPADAEPEGVFIEDPHGGVFADFQASYDRGADPFSAVDSFCTAHPAAEGRVDSMPGITGDTISVHHARNKLEDAAAIGFGIEVGDTSGMFQAFIDAINDCGGIRGRQLVLSESGYSPLGDVLTETTASCLSATEDNEAVITMNSSGLQGAALLCWTEEHESILISTQAVPEEFVARSENRLIATVLSGEQSARNLVNVAHDAGELDGKTIAVVWPDTPGLPEQVNAGLVDELIALGYDVAVAEELGCAGGSVCSEGVSEAVGAMVSSGVDAVFAPLNILSLPSLVTEMVTQGYQPGDVTFFQSNLNSQEGDLVSSKVVAFGGEDAGLLYNNAFIVTSSWTSLWQNEDGFIPPFNDMCLDTYEQYGGVSHDYFSAESNTPAGMTATVCVEVRIMARLLYNAGDNPTQESLREAIVNLGPVDTNSMIPGVVDGSGSTPRAVQIQRFTYPCQLEAAYDENDTCMVSSEQFFPLVD